MGWLPYECSVILCQLQPHLVLLILVDGSKDLNHVRDILLGHPHAHLLVGQDVLEWLDDMILDDDGNAAMSD